MRGDPVVEVVVCERGHQVPPALAEGKAGGDRGRAAPNPDELDRLLDPAAYTGLAGPFVDRVVREARRLNR